MNENRCTWSVHLKRVLSHFLTFNETDSQRVSEQPDFDKTNTTTKKAHLPIVFAEISLSSDNVSATHTDAILNKRPTR